MKLKKDFIIHSTGEEEILLAVNEEAKRFHGIVKLNETASKIAHLLLEDVTLSDIVDAFAKEYPDVDRTTLEEDIQSVIDQLNNIHALENI